MADVNILFSGYDSITQTYNNGGYNEDVAFTGLASALGTAAVVIAQEITVTGEEASASAGNTT